MELVHNYLFYVSNLKPSKISIDLVKMGKYKSGDFNLFYEIFGDYNQLSETQYKGLLGKSINRKILEKNLITLEELLNSFNCKIMFKSDGAPIGSERRYLYRLMKWIIENNLELDFLELHFIHRNSPWYIISYWDIDKTLKKIEVCIYQGNEYHIGYHEIDKDGLITFSLDKYKRFYNRYMTYDNCYEN